MNIFIEKNRKSSSYVCKIVSKQGKTLCIVKDSRGRKFNAESDGSYKVGESVIVRSGIVIGRSKRTRTVVHYNV